MVLPRCLRPGATRGALAGAAGEHGLFAAAALTAELRVLLPAALASEAGAALLPPGQAAAALLRAPHGPPVAAALALNVPHVRRLRARCVASPLTACLHGQCCSAPQ